MVEFRSKYGYLSKAMLKDLLSDLFRCAVPLLVPELNAESKNVVKGKK